MEELRKKQKQARGGGGRKKMYKKSCALTFLPRAVILQGSFFLALSSLPRFKKPFLRLFRSLSLCLWSLWTFGKFPCRPARLRGREEKNLQSHFMQIDSDTSKEFQNVYHLNVEEGIFETDLFIVFCSSFQEEEDFFLFGMVSRIESRCVA